MPPASLTRAYEGWLGSWEAALAALTTATESKALGTREAEAHRAAIATERVLVIEQFAFLIGVRGRQIRVTDQGVAPMSDAHRDETLGSRH